jgi:transposase-like protein
MRKTYTAHFKAQVVLDLLKDEKTLAQLASEHGVHPNMLREWKTIVLRALPGAFEQRDTVAATQVTHAQQMHELYAEIGQLTTQLNWLKKKLQL